MKPNAIKNYQDFLYCLRQADTAVYDEGEDAWNILFVDSNGEQEFFGEIDIDQRRIGYYRNKFEGKDFNINMYWPAAGTPQNSNT